MYAMSNEQKNYFSEVLNDRGAATTVTHTIRNLTQTIVALQQKNSTSSELVTSVHLYDVLCALVQSHVETLEKEWDHLDQVTVTLLEKNKAVFDDIRSVFERNPTRRDRVHVQWNQMHTTRFLEDIVHSIQIPFLPPIYLNYQNCLLLKNKSREWNEKLERWKTTVFNTFKDKVNQTQQLIQTNWKDRWNNESYEVVYKNLLEESLFSESNISRIATYLYVRGQLTTPAPRTGKPPHENRGKQAEGLV